MKNIFQIGDKKIFERTVLPTDTATFETGMVHAVYATFAIARDAEWAGRLFVLDMKEEDEEGIGTFISVRHLKPVAVGTKVTFEAVLTAIEGNRIQNSFTAYMGNEIFATGDQEQRILKREKLEQLLPQP
ncbi:MAG: hypothetical protein SFW35_09305 [Chitinophagales bacterium]|nr:hypothetical protein [Chitinophagales bacterium]